MRLGQLPPVRQTPRHSCPRLHPILMLELPSHTTSSGQRLRCMIVVVSLLPPQLRGWLLSRPRAGFPAAVDCLLALRSALLVALRRAKTIRSLVRPGADTSDGRTASRRAVAFSPCVRACGGSRRSPGAAVRLQMPKAHATSSNYLPCELARPLCRCLTRGPAGI